MKAVSKSVFFPLLLCAFISATLHPIAYGGDELQVFYTEQVEYEAENLFDKLNGQHFDGIRFEHLRSSLNGVDENSSYMVLEHTGGGAAVLTGTAKGVLELLTKLEDRQPVNVDSNGIFIGDFRVATEHFRRRPYLTHICPNNMCVQQPVQCTTCCLVQGSSCCASCIDTVE